MQFMTSSGFCFYFYFLLSVYIFSMEYFFFLSYGSPAKWIYFLKLIKQGIFEHFTQHPGERFK